jgi:ABC-type transport system substrate-binding protein
MAHDATKSPNAPVESLTTPDDKTVVMKLKQPNASILAILSARDIMYLGPREMESGFDPRKVVRGHGPYILDEYVPSARFVYAKNPNYYLKDRPFPDKVEVPIVTEPAARIAQFKAGNIWTDVLQNSQENIVITKKDVPETNLMLDGRFPETSSMMLTFGWEQGSPMRDQRVRQALSMMVDREAYIDVIDNRDQFKKEGLDVAVRRNSVVAGGWGDMWLDPTNQKEFGPNAKYLDLNLDEAKKLLAAAGVTGMDLDINFAGQGQYGAAYDKAAQLFAGMFLNGGLKAKQVPITPNDRWLNDFSRVYTGALGGGKRAGFNGLSMVAERTYPTLAVQLFNQFNKEGQGYRGMVPAGSNVLDGDPKSNDMAIKISQEYDREKQKTLVHDLIRYETEQTFYIPRVSSAKPFTLWWPAVGNANALIGPPGAGFWADLRVAWWVDDSKAPVKKA